MHTLTWMLFEVSFNQVVDNVVLVDSLYIFPALKLSKHSCVSVIGYKISLLEMLQNEPFKYFQIEFDK